MIIHNHQIQHPRHAMKPPSNNDWLHVAPIVSKNVTMADLGCLELLNGVSHKGLARDNFDCCGVNAKRTKANSMCLDSHKLPV